MYIRTQMNPQESDPLSEYISSDLASSAFLQVFQALHYGELHIKQDPTSGIVAIIAIHSTELGPALGGCRFVSYENDTAAIIDALRLGHSMSYKAAIAELPFGGGKAVLIHPKGLVNRSQLFRFFGHFVHSLAGRYITAEDSGTGVTDMDLIHQVTPFVTGHSQQILNCKDPSPLTALGIRRGIEAAIKFKLQKSSLHGVHVAIKGVGQVGYQLAKALHSEGALLTVADIKPELGQRCVVEFNAKLCAVEKIHAIACDVFSPCALSNAINNQTFAEIQAPIIAGSANNQLENPALAQQLAEKGILYAPDYVINAGGLIHVTAPYIHLDEQDARQKISNIYQTLLTIFERATQENRSTLAIANEIAEKRLQLSN